MARKTRLHVPGGLYHVMLRGNGGQDIFFEAEDRYRLYLLIQQGIAIFGHRVHAFCCMNNHIHLAVQVAQEPLSRIMQNLSFRYTRWINNRQSRTGHLFQGRYKSILVDADNYLLDLVRYIHLNPVRAGIVDSPEDYAWSGHRAYLGEERLPWLESDWVLGQFNEKLSAARQRYRAFVAAGLNDGHRPEFHCGNRDVRVLADDRFLQNVLDSEQHEVAGSHIPLESIVDCVSSDYEISKDDLQGPSQNRRLCEARTVIGWLSREFGSTTIKEVAEYFNRSPSTFSRHVGKIDVGLKGAVDLKQKLDGYVEVISQR